MSRRTAAAQPLGAPFATLVAAALMVLALLLVAPISRQLWRFD